MKNSSQVGWPFWMSITQQEEVSQLSLAQQDPHHPSPHRPRQGHRKAQQTCPFPSGQKKTTDLWSLLFGGSPLVHAGVCVLRTQVRLIQSGSWNTLPRQTPAYKGNLWSTGAGKEEPRLLPSVTADINSSPRPGQSLFTDVHFLGHLKAYPVRANRGNGEEP